MGKVPLLTGPRGGEIWKPLPFPEMANDTAFDIEIVDRGNTLLIVVTLEPSDKKVTLLFDRMDVIAYTVGLVDRVNHVNIDEFGAVYEVENSDFAERESIEWEGQYKREDTHHLAIPSSDLTVEILSLEYPRILAD